MAGHATKIWALVRNMGGNFYGVGWDTKIKWLATEYSTPQGDLLVGFGTSPEELDVTDSSAVADAIHEFLPDAEVVSTDSHDWNADEFSQGTWMAYRPGQVMRHASALQRPEGRLTFAGSDLASGWAGWIDGAIESGHRAARASVEVLAAPSPGVNGTRGRAALSNAEKKPVDRSAAFGETKGRQRNGGRQTDDESESR